MNNTNLQKALHCTSLKWAVFPLHYITSNSECSCGGPTINKKCKPGKHPYGKLVPRGLNDATTDSAVVQQWFGGGSSYNIGIATGNASGLWVLDIDGSQGIAALAALESEHGALPATLRVKTGGGGWHYYFRMPNAIEIKNSEKLVGSYIDVRGTGGYVVGAGSNHASGTDYTWDNCIQPSIEQIADAPLWLIALATKQVTATQAVAPKNSPMFSHLLQNDFVWPDKIEDGEGRESFILKAAGHLRGKGLGQSTIERFLLDYNSAHIAPPLTDDVVLDKARRFQNPELLFSAGNAHDESDSDAWQEPETLKATLPPVEVFDESLLPPSFRARVSDIADRMQCPIDFLAVGIMVAAGSVVGNKIAIQPKELDSGWIEVPNLWGAVVGRPGVMKSPALTEVLAPLRVLEANAQQAFRLEEAVYQIALMKYESAKKAVENSIKKGVTVHASQFPVKPDEPQPKRHLLNDATYQKLGAVLGANPHGLMVFQDELAGLLVRLDTEGQESARAFYLQAWDGKQSYTFDRIARGTVLIPRLCFSILGSIQPSKLREYLRSAVYGGKGDDGLAQRLQMLVYPDISPDWTLVDKQPDLSALTTANAVFTQLAALDSVAIGATVPPFGGIPTLNFNAAAQGLFNDWWSGLENALRKGSRHAALESHLSKYRKLIPALALLDHLIEGHAGGITEPSLVRAIAWGKYLFSHAKRAYAAVTAATMDSATALAARITQGALKNGFTVREIYRHNWSMLATQREATDAAEVLVDLGWLKPYTEKTPGTDGRPSVRYLINPRIQRAA